MKRFRNIACIVGLLVAMSATFASAAGDFEITGSYPENEQKNTTVENVAVKVQFSKDVDSKDNQEANDKCFNLVDDEGEKLPIRVYYNPEDAKEVLVLADTTEMNAKEIRIKDNSEYTLKISADLTANDGTALGTDEEIMFKTMNQSRNNMIYTVMMIIMFVGMFYFSSRQMKKHAAEEAGGQTKEEPFNPYKEAKKTGKSVEQVMAEHEKEVAKKAAKEAKHAKHEPEEEEEEVIEDNGNYKVKGPRPISAGGSSYITGRKAIAEAKKAEEERLARRRSAAKKKKKK